MAIQIIFDGDFVEDHNISLRTLAQTYSGMQKALERAYIDINRDGISKGDRITKEERRATEFYLEGYQDGSFIVSFRESTNKLKSAIDRLGQEILDPYTLSIEDGEMRFEKILEEAKVRQKYAQSNIQTYDEALKNSGIYTPRQYGKKSMASYISESLNPVKSSEGENSITYRLFGNTSFEFYFNLLRATRFTKALAMGRELGPEIIYESYVIKLDGKSLKGVIRHKLNKREVTIIFIKSSDYNKAVSYNKLNDDGSPMEPPMKFVGYAVREMGILDLAAGDVIFKHLLE